MDIVNSKSCTNNGKHSENNKLSIVQTLCLGSYCRLFHGLPLIV